ncbi:protein MpRLK-Pelle_SD-2b3 [Marchantia polymorpha subsp. ruderalis]|nr:hypothetical protein MARPO_0086s0059 [Marchantia polymorpha]BBN11041.1 hypothetical protein Mp_5g08540 [Marchantia polymorpha subsp. ruderalis]|eukprot:PTQ33740.1 hypothetical protein MARPO_0086s0059 [Marchantia polymorpha]
MATGVQCDTMDIRSLNFGGFTDTHRNIISVDIDGYYALGFQQITRGEFFLSIYPFYPTDDSAGPAIWTANRNWPVDENGTLGFLSTGTLELRDSRGTVMWCTRTHNRGVEKFVFSPEHGKIELLTATNDSIWSSFDDPSDTVVENQVLSYMGGAVVSSETREGRGTGRYSMVVKAGGLVLYARSENGSQFQPYRAFGLNGRDDLQSVLHTCRFASSVAFLLPSSRFVAILREKNSSVHAVLGRDVDPELCAEESFNNNGSERGLFDLDTLINSTWPSRVAPSLTKALKLEYNGTLTLYAWRRGVQISPTATDAVDLFGSDDACSFPDRCGPFGVCITDPLQAAGYSCSCPRSPDDDDQLPSSSSWPWEEIEPGVPSHGCRLLAGTPTCKQDRKVGGGSELLELRNVDYFANDFLTPMLVSQDACRQQCLQDCSCVGAFYRSFPEGQCFLQSQPFHSLRSANLSFTAFIKVSSSTAEFSTTYAFLLIMGTLAATLLGALVVCAFCIRRRQQRRCYNVSQKFFSLQEDLFLDTLSSLPPRLPLKVLEKATKGFRDKLGEGGFGAVYNGLLPDGTKVAVKRLEGPGQGVKEFRAEVATIGSIHHKNLVQLCGFCVEGAERLLVYEHMANGSLDSLLFSDTSTNSQSKLGKDGCILAWATRMSVAKDTARGLAYLHEGCREKIIHLDIKPQNILLDEHFLAKVADFGLSTLVKRDKQSLVVTQMRGTPGYLAPEWLHMSAVTEKADVYSYGMVLLELVSGRRIVEPDKVFLPAWAFQRFKCGQLQELIDPKIADSVNMDEAHLMIRVAFSCIQENPLERPSMSLVVQMLEGLVAVPQPPRFGQMPRILSMSTISLSSSSSDSSSPNQSCTDDSNRLGHSFNGLGQRATDRGYSYLMEGGLSTAYIHSITAPR